MRSWWYCPVIFPFFIDLHARRIFRLHLPKIRGCFPKPMSVGLTAISRRIAGLAGVFVVGLLSLASLNAAIQVATPGWGGKSLERVVLDGSDARQQLLVTESLPDGFLVDHTRTVRVTTRPEGLVRVTNGLVEPVVNGVGQITVETEAGEKASIPFEVKNATLEKQVNFPNSIVPLFTKHGCNGGGCHGKSGGQNGFKLSLLGFEPPEDYEYLLPRGARAAHFPGRAGAQSAFAESQRPVAARRRITD